MNKKADPVDRALEALRKDKWSGSPDNSALENRLLKEFGHHPPSQSLKKPVVVIIALFVFLTACGALAITGGFDTLKRLFVSVNGQRIELKTGEDGTGAITIETVDGLKAVIKVRIASFPQNTTPEIVKVGEGCLYNFSEKERLIHPISKEVIEKEAKRPYKLRSLHRVHINSSGIDWDFDVEPIFDLEYKPAAQWNKEGKKKELYVIPRAGQRPGFLLVLSTEDKFGNITLKMVGATGTSIPEDEEDFVFEFDPDKERAAFTVIVDGVRKNLGSWGVSGRVRPPEPFKVSTHGGVMLIEIETTEGR